MGKNSGYFLLITGIISLSFSIVRPGLIFLGIAALVAGILNVIGVGRPKLEPTPPMYATDEETIFCAHCSTENLAIAKSCRGCAKPLVKTQAQPPIDAGTTL